MSSWAAAEPRKTKLSKQVSQEEKQLSICLLSGKAKQRWESPPPPSTWIMESDVLDAGFQEHLTACDGAMRE